MPPLSGFASASFKNTNSADDPRQQMSSQMTAQKKKKPWYTALISEGAGTGGAIGGAAAGAALGSVVPVLGTVIGGLAGAGIGGFLGATGGKAVENKIRDDQNFTGAGGSAKAALKEGAITGALSVGPGNLLKLAKGGSAAVKGGSAAFAAATAGKAPEELLKTSARGKLYDKGTSLIAGQYGTISKPVARATDPLDTISKLADAGITKPVDAERIARGFTGADGLTNTAVVNAVGAADKVNLSHIEGVVDKALKAHGVEGSHAKSIKSFVTAQIERSGDPSSVDPKTALDIMRNIEAQTAEVVGKGGTYHLATTENALQSKALRDIKDEVGNALYETAGANKNIATVLTPGFRDELLKLQPGNPKWQKFVDGKVMTAKSVADLRSTMAPFVRISKIIDEGDTNALTFGGRVANPLAGAGIGSALLGIGGKIVKDPAQRFAGNALRAGATAGLGGIEAPAARSIIPRVALGSADPSSLMNPSAASAAPQSSPAQDPNSLLTGAPGSPSADQTGSLLGQTNAGGDITAQLLGQPQTQQSQNGGPSLATLQQAIQEDIQNNQGKGIGQLMQLGQLYGLVDSSGNPVDPNAPGKSSTGTPTAQQGGLVTSGISGLSQLAQLIQTDPSVITRNATPGQGTPLIGSLISNVAGASDYHALADSVLANLIHLQTGATATKEEIAAARGQLPQPNDPPETRQRKLANLYTTFQSFTGGTAAPSGNLLTQTNGL